MVSFPRPSFEYDADVATEVAALRHYRDNEPGRQIPAKRDDRLLVATWNVANLGLQDRNEVDHQLIAEIISWFDLIAVQEVNDDLSGLRAVMEHLPEGYRAMFSDKGGNEERAAYLFDNDKLTQLEMFGEVAVPPKDVRHIKLPGVTATFGGFDRNPFIGSFVAGELEMTLVNVHLFYGDDTRADRERRALEAYATSRWADLRRDDEHAYTPVILALGDFNLPKVEPGDLIYTALRRRGLRRPEHSTRIASNISDDADYDQIMFFPGQTADVFTGEIGVFDFDGAVFAEVWEERTAAQFRSYTRYHLSDHRPLWAEFKTA